MSACKTTTPTMYVSGANAPHRALPVGEPLAGMLLTTPRAREKRRSAPRVCIYIYIYIYTYTYTYIYIYIYIGDELGPGIRVHRRVKTPEGYGGVGVSSLFCFCVCIYLSIYLSVCLSIYLSIYLSISLSLDMLPTLTSG